MIHVRNIAVQSNCTAVKCHVILPGVIMDAVDRAVESLGIKELKPEQRKVIDAFMCQSLAGTFQNKVCTNVSAVGEKNELVTIPVTGASARRISMIFLSKEDTALFSGVSTIRLAPHLLAISQPKQKSIAMPTHVGAGVTMSTACHQTLPL